MLRHQVRKSVEDHRPQIPTASDAVWVMTPAILSQNDRSRITLKLHPLDAQLDDGRMGRQKSEDEGSGSLEHCSARCRKIHPAQRRSGGRISSRSNRRSWSCKLRSTTRRNERSWKIWRLYGRRNRRSSTSNQSVACSRPFPNRSIHLRRQTDANSTLKHAGYGQLPTYNSGTPTGKIYEDSPLPT